MKNFEKYKTTKERVDAFRKFCNPVVWNCTRVCKVGKVDESGGVDQMKCFSNWLDLEADVDKPMDCPFCGSQCKIMFTVPAHDYFFVQCSDNKCSYSSRIMLGENKAIAAHNRVARAVAKDNNENK